MTLSQELKKRGLIAQFSHEDEICQLLDKGKLSFYIGFDATADSLHAGSFLQLAMMRRLQNAGHKPHALLGTGTSLVGDPSGKTDMRQMLGEEEINKNAGKFKEQMSRFIDFSDSRDNGGEFVKNGDWLLDLKYLEFIREIGVHFSVNKMLSAECFKNRMERGLSFFEFNYMLIQSYDFLHLFKTKGVTLQIGGDDQWSNILSGADLIRRKEQKSAYAMTTPLLLTKDGKKMGKTQKGALWLDADKCPPYEFYQYFRNVDDLEVIDCLKMLTFVPLEEIEDRENFVNAKEGTKINETKELLAYEMTALIHGKDEAGKAMNAAKSVFFGTGESEDMPTTVLSGDDFDSNGKIGVLDLIVKTGLCSSKRDARTTVEQGGLSIDGEKITDINALIEIKDYAVIKKGKKTFHKASRSEHNSD